MKKIFYSFLFAVAALGITTSCSEDRDSNPVLNTQGLSLVLNTPGVAYNNTLDLLNSKYVVLTTSQPDYGYTAPTTYTVYVSMDNENFTALGTTYRTARMEISAEELNQALLDIVGDANVDQLAEAVEVYFKVTAHLTGEDTMGLVESNVVKLPSVLAYVPVVELALPTEMYIVGSFAASNGWSEFVPLHFAYSQDGFSYGIVYFNAGDEFKINPDAGWKGNDKGFGQVTIGASNDAGVVNGGDSETSNMKASNAGWYTVIVKNKIVGNAIDYELQTKEAKVYLFGAGAVGEQWSFDDANLFTMSSSATEPCVSPAMGGSGELRIAVDCGIDWWKTEFTIKSDGTLYYRDVDIPSNWNDALGADYSFQTSAGKQIYLDFTNGTGSQQ